MGAGWSIDGGTMGFTFTILGPLTVRRSAEPLALGPVKRRAMLATLVLAANDPVGIDRLADTVWDTPPRSAVANLRTHAAALRPMLRDHDGRDRLQSPRRAYRLTVRDGELDLAMFDELSERGRDALAAGDPTTAARHFATALDLWQGEPAQNVPAGALLESMLAPLRERRLVVFEAYADTRLSLAEHSAILADLQQQSRLHPHRERLTELLALARYRSGDVAGALDAITESFTRLREDLGIDPGDSLNELQQAILRRDPDLTKTAAIALRRPVVVQRVRPHGLPPDPPVLTGRDAELRQLSGVLDASGSTAVAVLSGPAGAGTSAVALRAAHRAAGRFAAGELYADLRAAEPFDVLARFLRALGVDDPKLPESHEDRTDLFRSVTAPGVLVVLDHAAEAAQVKPLLPGPGSAAIVTSRQRLTTVDGATLLDLGPLPVRDAVTALDGMLADGRVAAEPGAARELVELCDGLPLAIRIAAARLTSRPHWPVRLLADQLADPRRRLDLLTFDDLSIRSALSSTYDVLATADPLAARAFRRVGTLPARTVDAAIVATVLGGSSRDAADALERLVDVRLLDSTEPERYHLTALTRLYAAELYAAPCQSTPVPQRTPSDPPNLQTA